MSYRFHWNSRLLTLCTIIVMQAIVTGRLCSVFVCASFKVCFSNDHWKRDKSFGVSCRFLDTQKSIQHLTNQLTNQLNAMGLSWSDEYTGWQTWYFIWCHPCTHFSPSTMSQWFFWHFYPALLLWFLFVNTKSLSEIGWLRRVLLWTTDLGKWELRSSTQE